jgi:ribosome-associated protein
MRPSRRPSPRQARIGPPTESRDAVPLAIAPGIEIPDRELSVTFVRASGPGGQNVNKVATAAQLRFDLAGDAALAEPVKERLRRLSGRRLTLEGAILIVARRHRTQEANRREAEERLADLIRGALVAPKLRQATRPTRAARERRLEDKRRQRRTKRLRGRPRLED